MGVFTKPMLYRLTRLNVDSLKQNYSLISKNNYFEKNVVSTK